MTASGHACARTQAAERFLDGKPVRIAAATALADDPAGCVSSSPEESKLFGLAHNDAVADTSRERQRQESAGQTAHNAPRASPADDLLPGEAERKPASTAAPDLA